MQWATTTHVLNDLANSNDAVAWYRFQEQFYPVVVAFAKRMGLSSADAEDAAQETMMTFVRAFRDGKYDREKGRLSHWLFGIARRVILNFRKRLGPERQIGAEETGTSFWNRLPDDRALRDTWTAEWRDAVVSYCLQRVGREFDEMTFNAFQLYALTDMPADQVARRLNISRSAVYIAKCRVLSRLRQLREEFQGDAGGVAS